MGNVSMIDGHIDRTLREQAIENIEQDGWFTDEYWFVTSDNKNFFYEENAIRHEIELIESGWHNDKL